MYCHAIYATIVYPDRREMCNLNHFMVHKGARVLRLRAPSELCDTIVFFYTSTKC